MRTYLIQHHLVYKSLALLGALLLLAVSAPLAANAEQVAYGVSGTVLQQDGSILTLATSDLTGSEQPIQIDVSQLSGFSANVGDQKSLTIAPRPYDTYLAIGPLPTGTEVNLDPLYKALLSPSFEDVPDSVHRGHHFDVRVSAPDGATCEGVIDYHGTRDRSLGETDVDNGECRWDARVPDDANTGDATIEVTAKLGDAEQTIYNGFTVK